MDNVSPIHHRITEFFYLHNDKRLVLTTPGEFFLR
jgi:hypothetical protein